MLALKTCIFWQGEQNICRRGFTSISLTTMKIYTFVAPVLISALVLAATVVTTPVTLAACSQIGFINSQGKCVNSFPSAWNWSYQYQNRYVEFHDQTLLALIEHLREMIRQLEEQVGEDLTEDEVSVATRSAIDVSDDSATLRGRVILGDYDEATVYFEYGRSRADLDKKTSDEVIEEGDDYAFETDVDGLYDDTVYYYRAVAEAENDTDHGAIYSFKTLDTSVSDEPTLSTYSATNIEETSARLGGYVDMNDYRNGTVFLVYGEDESSVDDIADDYNEYVEIEESGDDLQKVLLDSDLDSSATYQKTVYELDSDSTMYHSICVEYEDTDDDAIIVCGDTKSFKTDN